jgi:hypothetical protein
MCRRRLRWVVEEEGRRGGEQGVLQCVAQLQLHWGQVLSRGGKLYFMAYTTSLHHLQSREEMRRQRSRSNFARHSKG